MSPQAGVRVTGIDAGETLAVDIRMPLEVTHLAPAAKLGFQVLVDANQEIGDVDRANNGAEVRQADILPVDPAVFEVNLTTAAAGGEVTLAGEGLGPEPGEVLVHLGGVEMEAQVLGWYDLGVRIALPKLPLAAATQAEIIVVRGDGAAANPVPLTIAPSTAPATDTAPATAAPLTLIGPRQVPPPPATPRP